MEPKLNNLTARPEFPPEPQFHEATEEKVEVPRIVPADLHKALPTPNPEEEVQINPSEEKVLDAPLPASSEGMLSQLSKDLEELSRPLEKGPKANFETNTDLDQTRETPVPGNKELSKPETKENTLPENKRTALPVNQRETPESKKIVPYDEGLPENPIGTEMAFPTFDDLGDPEEPSSSHPFIKSLMLLLCLGAIVVAAWQVCLFLQPDFMKSPAFSDISQQSCQYLYCPPLRTLKIADEEMDETGPGKWIVTFRVLNQDIRPQQLPHIQLTVEGVSKSVFRKTYAPSDYTIIPRGPTIESGTASKVEIPFDFTEGQPTKFTVRVAESK